MTLSIFTNREPNMIWIYNEKSIVWFLGITGSIVLFSSSSKSSQTEDYTNSRQFTEQNNKHSNGGNGSNGDNGSNGGNSSRNRNRND